jgi:hypothetical protein
VANEGVMPNIRSTDLLWGLGCALALVIGLIAGRMGLVGQTPNTQTLANFRADFPLNQVQGKTFKNETVQLDGNDFINCTFDNVILKFEGQAPFRFTNAHFVEQSKFSLASDNPAVKAALELMGGFLRTQNPAQNQPKDNK